MSVQYLYPSSNFNLIFAETSEETRSDSGFQCISGIGADMNYDYARNLPGKETQTELPIHFIHPPLILTRSVRQLKDSFFTQWIADALRKSLCKPLLKLTLQLMDENHKPVMSWSFFEVVPKSWKLGELNAMSNDILIETFELTYQSLTIDF